MSALSYADGLQLWELHREREEEERAWDMWISQYPHMDEKTFIPFVKFLDDLKVHSKQKAAVATRGADTEAEILARMERIKAADQGREVTH